MSAPNPQECFRAQQNPAGGAPGSFAAGNIECTHVGVETQDFVSCRKIAKAISGFLMAKKANRGLQETRTTAKSKKELAKLEEKKADRQPLGDKDFLGAQREGVKLQSQMAYETAALHGAEFAAIGAMLASMPTRKKLKVKCTNALKNLEVPSTFTDINGWPSPPRPRSDLRGRFRYSGLHSFVRLTTSPAITPPLRGCRQADDALRSSDTIGTPALMPPTLALPQGGRGNGRQ